MTFDGSHLWCDWIEYCGEGFPVQPGELVEAEFERFSDRALTSMTFFADPLALDWDWSRFGDLVEMNGIEFHVARILRYRVRRYAAASKMIADAVASAASVQR